MKETQEMLDFCGKHNITADIELISIDYINTAMERLAKSDVKYRFVIDIANSLSSSWLLCTSFITKNLSLQIEQDMIKTM